ncbi:MAG: AraC family transcriptional regulator [bacterium]
MRKHLRKIDAATVFQDRRFPLVVLKTLRHGPTELHGHAFHELVVILSGRGRHVTERETYPISAGDAFLLAGAEAHGYADTRDLALVNILFDPQRLHLPLADVGDIPGYQALFRVEPRLRSQDRLRSRLQLVPDELAAAAQLIARLQAELREQKPGHRFAACACLMDLILYLSRCYTRASAPMGGATLRLGQVLSFIEKNFAEPIRVSQLAGLAHMSESSLLRTFRQVMGTSPLDHVIRVRVGKAMELLRHGDVRVTEAAFQCGFRDSNYFARQFRKVTGRTPRQFR